jgi:hypothetical protein
MQAGASLKSNEYYKMIIIYNSTYNVNVSLNSKLTIVRQGVDKRSSLFRQCINDDEKKVDEAGPWIASSMKLEKVWVSRKAERKGK